MSLHGSNRESERRSPQKTTDVKYPGKPASVPKLELLINSKTIDIVLWNSDNLINNSG